MIIANDADPGRLDPGEKVKETMNNTKRAAKTSTTATETKGANTMSTAKNITTATKARKSPLESIKARAEHVEKLLQEPITPAARIELIGLLSRAVAYHDSGKIEGILSLDVSCRNCSFCQKMQSCGDPEVICTYCYTCSMYETAKAAHAIIGEILSRMELTPEEAAAVAIPAGRIRYNCDGELINLTHAINLLRITAAHPFSTCTIWTKRPGILGKAIKQEGKPANLIAGISSPIINQPFTGSFSWADFIFTVYTPGRILQAIAEGAHPCNGRKCLDCGFKCYTKTADDAKRGPLHVAEVLRKPRGIKNPEFEALCATIDAKG